jgi:hypothetical protein
MGVRTGELSVLNELPDVAIEGRTDHGEFGETDTPHSHLDPVVGHARHA